MKIDVTARGAEGLASRLAARALAPATERAAASAAEELATLVAAETGAAPEVAGAPGRPLVRISDAAALERLRGGVGEEGDAALDRARLAFARSHGASATTRRAGTP